MPTYDIRCPLCDFTSEAFVLLSEHTGKFPSECPKHGKQEFEQLFTVGAAHDWGQGRFFEHASAKGETFYSKKAWRNYKREHGLRERMSFTE